MTDAGAGGASRAVLRQHSLRASNLGLVMRSIVGADAPSRADIAAATGMTRSTVSRLVDELIAGGLVAELDPLSGNRGRPATPLVPTTGRVVAVGCEVEVTHVTVRVVDLSGLVLAERDVPMNSATMPAAEALSVLAAQIDACMAEVPDVEVVGLGLAIPGVVASESLQVLEAPNLGWHNLELQPMLLEAGVPIDRWPLRLSNEADAAALTVAQIAPGRSSGRDSFLYVSGETGIGSAVVSHGEVAAGRHGWAGELGHVFVDPTGRVCGCGATGCLESVVGTEAVLHDLGIADLDTFRDRLNGDDPATLAVVRNAGRTLGTAIAGALNLLDLQDVVLGGFLAEIGPTALPEIEAELQRRVISARFLPLTVDFVLGDECSATGAAYGCLTAVISEPATWLDRHGTTRPE